MNEADALKLVQDAIWAVIVGSGPAVGAATVVGVVIALIQALTQVQEATLTFVPKILLLFATFVLTIPFMSTTLIEFTRELMARAVGIPVGPG